MRTAAALLALALALGAAPARAQYAGGAAPTAPGLIGMSLMEALVAIRRPELAGVFAYVPEGQATVAMADLLLRDRDSLKRFLKKSETDVSRYNLINAWDREVCAHLVASSTGNGITVPGTEPLPKKLLDRVSALVLAQPVPLSILVQRRGIKR